MKKVYIWITLIVACVIISVILYSGDFRGKPVETGEQAVSIAKEFVFNKYKQNFDKFEIKSEIEGNTWIVYYMQTDIDGNPCEGGGGPELHIKKSNGKVISCLLQK